MKKFLALILFLFALTASAQTVNHARMLSDPNFVPTGPYTFVAKDSTRLVVFTSSSATAATLPSSDNQGFGAGYLFSVANQGSGLVTITPAAGTIKGNPSLAIGAGQGCDIYGDGTNYEANCGVGSGGGSTPQGPAGTIQSTDGAGNLAASNIREQSGTATVSENIAVTGNQTVTGTSTLTGDTTMGGPNPSGTDCRIYGCFSASSSIAPQIPGITATGSGGSSNLTLSAASTFTNGMYVNVIGGGATTSLATPSAPTVTPIWAAGPMRTGITVPSTAASTTYNYKIVAIGQAGDYSVASTAGTTTTGQATLGAKSINITSETRSGTTMTATATSHGLVTGVYGEVTQASDGTFSGDNIITVTGGSTFTYTSQYDTNSGATTTSTGGKIGAFAGNKITWSHVAGALRYIVYSDRATPGTFVPVCVSLPDDGLYTDMALSCEDYGSPINDNLTLPFWIPTTAPASAGNQNLQAKILSGGGTTSITLSTPLINAVSGATILSDNGPAIIATATAAGPGGNVYIPLGTYPVNSYLAMPNTATVCQAGTLVLNETLQTSNASDWSGECIPHVGSTPQFSFTGKPLMQASRAYPAVYTPASSNSFSFHGVTISGQANHSYLMLVDAGNPVSVWNTNFITTSANDYLGMNLVLRGLVTNSVFQNRLEDLLFSSGPNQVSGATSTPIAYLNNVGITSMSNLTINRRGILLRPASAGLKVNLDGQIRTQGGITPNFITYYTGGTASIAINGSGASIELDTMAHPFLVNLAAASIPSLTLGPIDLPSGDGVSNPPLISGYSTFVNGFCPTTFTNCIVGTFNSNKQLQVNGTTGSVGTKMGIPSAPSLGVSAGGAVPVATHTYAIAPFDSAGNLGTIGPTSSIATTGGNQTVTVTPVGLPLGASGYAVYRDGLFTQNSIAQCNTPFTVNGGGAYVDTAASTCNTNTFPFGVADSSSINAAGMNTFSLQLTNNGFTQTRTVSGLSSNTNVNELLVNYTPAGINVGQTVTGPWSLSGGSLFEAGVRSVTGTSDTILAADNRKLVRYANASAIGVTLPQANTVGFTSGALFRVQNNGVGNVNITPTTSQINGAGSLAVTTGQSYEIYSDGTNYWALGGAPAGGSGITSINALTGATQTLTKTDDTNVTLTIVDSGSDHKFNLGWTGTAAKSRLPGTTVYTDTASTFSASFPQTFPGGSLFCGTVNPQAGTTYTVVAADNCKLVTFTNASSIAVTLSQASNAGFTAGAVFHFKNKGPGLVTITPSVSTIDGLTSFPLSSGNGIDLYSDGVNYSTQGGSSAGSGTINSCAAAGNAYYGAAGTTISCDTQVTDNGAGTFTAPTFNASGSNGGLDFTGGTGAGLTPTAGHGLLFYSNSTNRFIHNDNNGSNDNMVGAATTDTLTNKTYDIAGTGNAFKGGSVTLNAIQGNGAKIQAATGTTTTGNCLKYDANGNAIDSGIACNSGGGTVTTTGSPVSGDLACFSASTSITTCGAQYKTVTCQAGLGDGLNAITAGTYLQFTCVNRSGATRTITGISCWTDNAGTSTLQAANNAGTNLLTGAVTCNATKSAGGAAGTQSGTTTLANNDAISFTFVADGTSKQSNWTVVFTE